MRCTIFTLLLLLPGLAFAEKREVITVGLRANGISVEGAQGAVGLGLNARVKLTPKWSLEGTADILEGQVAKAALPLSVNVIRYLLPDAPISLYGVAGAGFLRDDGSLTGELDPSRLFVSAGFGAELHLRKTVVAADLRYLVLDKAVGQSAADSFVFDTSEAGSLSVMVGRSF